MKKIVFDVIIIVLITGMAVWLWAYDKAAKPGALSSAHDFIADCETCHVPWRGVNEESCIKCHDFDSPEALEPWLRFHEAQEHCLDCHTEHRGYGADISKVDHTLFNPDLSCTDCHYDAHNGKFGEDCRACHRIDTWEIKGYRHPPAESKDCHRCHGPPASHHVEDFWDKIIEGHEMIMDREDLPDMEDCWRCHTTHRWGHLMMDPDL